MFNPERIGLYKYPHDLRANLKFRKDLLLEAQNDPLAQDQIYMMCRDDILFWINQMIWTYNPINLPAIPAEVPFITYEFQDEAIYELCTHIGNDNLNIEKTREMGASWVCMMAFVYFWQFWPGFPFLVLSSKQDKVDATDNPDTLFWKARFAIKNQPGWMQPLWTSKFLNITNCDNMNSIDGDATTGDMGRGGRRAAVLEDEAAAIPREEGYAADRSLHYVTSCLIKNSTPQGADGAYYDSIQNPHIKTLTFHWSRHPVKAAGMYRVNDNKEVEIIDKRWHEKNPNYQFVLTPGGWKGLRSPWYDKKCKSATSSREISQELDIGYAGSNYTFFNVPDLDDHIRKHGMEPHFRGALEYSMVTAEPKAFRKIAHGPLLIWLQMDQGMIPISRKYVIGCDIAMGTGSSNSALSVVDRQSGEKVASYMNPRITPGSFAKLAVAMCHMFNNAELIWESNGPGRLFGKKVIELGYQHIYYRKDEMKISAKPSDFPGWASTNENKHTLLGDYRDSLKDDTFINHDVEAVKECRRYIVVGSSIEHAIANSTDDQTAARANHGDIVIADALAHMLAKETRSNRSAGDAYKVGTVGHRIKLTERRNKQNANDTDWFAA